MNIEGLLAKYTELSLKRDKAYEEFRSFDILIHELGYGNETPIELKDVNGDATGFTITTPDDFWNISPGMVIAVCGAEWMLCEDKWMSCYGGVRNDTEMFIHILRNLNWTHLVHRGY